MSEEQTTTLINNELTERANNAFYAFDYKVFRANDECIVMIAGEKRDESKADTLLTLSEMEKMVEHIKEKTSTSKIITPNE